MTPRPPRKPLDPKEIIGSSTVDPAIQLYVLAQLHEQMKHVHEIEVRTLRDRVSDLTEQLRDAKSRVPIDPRQWQGVAYTEEEDETEPGKGKGDKENPLRKSNPSQWVLDSLEETIPLGNEQARAGVRSWVERQIRLRGQGSLDDILAEAQAGDITDEETDEVEE